MNLFQITLTLMVLTIPLASHSVEIENYRCNTHLDHPGDPNPPEWIELKKDTANGTYQLLYSENITLSEPRLLLSELTCSFYKVNSCDSFQFKSCTSENLNSLPTIDTIGTPILFMCENSDKNSPPVRIENTYLPQIKLNLSGNAEFFIDGVRFNGSGVPGFERGLLSVSLDNYVGACRIRLEN